MATETNECWIVQYVHIDNADEGWIPYARGDREACLVALRELRSHPSAEKIRYRVVHLVSTEEVLDW